MIYKHMAFPRVLATVISFAINSCKCDNKINEKKEYYANGVIKVRKNEINGTLEGNYTSYFENGKIENKAFFKNGKLFGIIYSYFENGKLKSRISMNDGKRDGSFALFYNNGSPKQTSVFSNDIQVGTTIMFDSASKKPMNRLLYDRKGRLFFSDEYDELNKMHWRALYPLFEGSDTVKWNSGYNACIHFGYSVPGEAVLVIGKLVEDKNNRGRFIVTDTSSVVTSDSKGYFCFSYKPNKTKIGLNVFSYKFLHKSNFADSLSLDELSGTHNFFVQPPVQ